MPIEPHLTGLGRCAASQALVQKAHNGIRRSAQCPLSAPMPVIQADNSRSRKQTFTSHSVDVLHPCQEGLWINPDGLINYRPRFLALECDSEAQIGTLWQLFGFLNLPEMGIEFQCS